MKRLITAIAVAMAISSAVADDNFKTGLMDPLTSIYTQEATHKGTIDTLSYYVNINDQQFEKQALVYLPYGYDAADQSKNYNVVYLAHGGGDNPGSWFSTDRTPYPLNIVADRLVEEEKMDPVIIVSASYYPPLSFNSDKGMENTIAYCKDFNKEVRKYLIPSVAKKYNTYLKSTDDDSITATRQHRAFGGFSMGSLTTWYQLAFDPYAFSNYLPLCGDLWTYDEEGEKLPTEISAKWLDDQLAATPFRGKDLNILAYTGDKDIAYVPELNLVKAIAGNSKYLSYSNDINSPDNLHFVILPDADHSYVNTNQYLADALPRLWK